MIGLELHHSLYDGLTFRSAALAIQVDGVSLWAIRYYAIYQRTFTPAAIMALRIALPPPMTDALQLWLAPCQAVHACTL